MESQEKSGLVPFGGTGSGLALISAMANAGIDPGTPFSNPIRLVSYSRVAGMARVEGAEAAADALAVGDQLGLVRESGNARDQWAICVHTSAGAKLGYVALDVNQILARLMDGGKRLFGKVVAVRHRGRTIVVEMDIWLDD